MDKIIELDISRNNHLPERLIYRITPGDKAMEWCIALSLLKYGIVSSITITGNQTALCIKTGRINKKIRNVRGEAKLVDAMVTLTISEDELDSWLFFYLRKVHGDTSEIEHLDVVITRLGVSLPYEALYVTLQ